MANEVFITHFWTNDGWHAYYFNDDLYTEGSPGVGHLLSALVDLTVTGYKSYHAKEDWITDTGTFPDKLVDVKREGDDE